MSKSVSRMSEAELFAERDRLLAENESLMAARGKAESEFKGKQQAVQAKLNAVAAALRVVGMSDTERAELAAALSEG